MFKASLETRHYSFEAYGTDATHAKDALRGGLVRHARQREANPATLIADLWGDIEVHEVGLGYCYRDKHKI